MMRDYTSMVEQKKVKEAFNKIKKSKNSEDYGLMEKVRGQWGDGVIEMKGIKKNGLEGLLSEFDGKKEYLGIIKINDKMILISEIDKYYTDIHEFTEYDYHFHNVDKKAFNKQFIIDHIQNNSSTKEIDFQAKNN